ncbi:rod-binding protein [Anatilimnocola sp. NA78]|uniref:rod-binding protein n=1 Tax=Anatilimnocola sp. NA78 TaxID=3415683 RepID=UPI003CE5395F
MALDITSAATSQAFQPLPQGVVKKSSTSETKEAFTDFVGQTMFGQALASMRKTIEKPAYFHGGRAEEVFQGQLDQLLCEELTEATADTFAGPMFDLFMLHRS